MKLKAAVIGFSYLAGLILAFYLEETVLFNLAAMLCAVITGVSFLIFRKPDFGVFFIVFGIAFGVYASYKITTLEHVLLLDGKTADVTGTVINKTAPLHDTCGYTIESVINGEKVRFSLYAPDTGAEIGDKLHFKARFSLLKDNTAFAEASYYMSKGVFLKAAAISEPFAEKAENFSVSKTLGHFNEFLKGKILTAFPNDTGAFICAVFLGDKSKQSASLSSDIRRAGISHYTAVSGLHLTLFTHLFLSVLNLTRVRVMRKLKFFILLFLILLFMVFFNLSPSVFRAGIMLIAYYGGEHCMRRGNTLNSAGFAVLIILLISPYACLDPGFLLSIAGTIGIGVIAPAVNRQLSESFGSSRFKVFRELFISNLCANWATLPLVAVFFGGASLVSFFTSIILLPFFMVLMISMLFFVLTAGISGSGGLPLFVAGLMSKIMQTVITFFGRMKFAYIPLDYGFITSWIVLSAIFILIIFLTHKKLIIKTAMISVFTLAVMVITTTYLTLDKTIFEIYTDGNSACIFIRQKNISIAVVTDDNIKISTAVSDFINAYFLDEISLLCVLKSTNNSLSAFSEIPAVAYIMPNIEDISYNVSDVFTVYKNGESVQIDYNGAVIHIGHIKTSSNADINVTYNSSANAGIFKNIVIHTSRKQEPQQNELHAYYEKISFFLN
ncbi:MAG: ComEC/Rec2 family competence protein [Oscillospiraceae bacterium]|nr:ComEC/Rec2 family competence protein [Oscillospiraceae bacterium]